MSIFIGNSEIKNAYIGTTPVKEIYVGTTKVRPTSRLPSAYQEVEYIQSSGTQYINTGYIPSNNTKVECSISNWNRNTGSYGTMFGARLSWSSSGRGFMLGLTNNASVNGGNAMFGGTYNVIPVLFGDGNSHNIEFSQNGLYEDGTLVRSLNTATFTSPGNMYIFALNNNGTTSEMGGFRLYSFKIYNSGTLTRDFVPCYRKSDSVIGLYDLVNNSFYTNAGSGTFTKGGNV